jgi:hypothetical protein
MSSARERALNSVGVGDVIFGVAAGGQDKLMLVYKADRDSIFARHVTSQTSVEFGRDGKSRRVPDGGSCTIISVAPLSPEDREIVVGLDRKMRTGRDYPDFVLSRDEVDLLLRHVEFFTAHPLPE